MDERIVKRRRLDYVSQDPTAAAAVGRLESYQPLGSQQQGVFVETEHSSTISAHEGRCSGTPNVYNQQQTSDYGIDVVEDITCLPGVHHASILEDKGPCNNVQMDSELWRAIDARHDLEADPKVCFGMVCYCHPLESLDLGTPLKALG